MRVGSAQAHSGLRWVCEADFRQLCAEEGRRLQEKLGNSVREVLLPLLEDNPVPSPSSAARAVIDLSTAAAFIVMPILNGLLVIAATRRQRGT